MTSRLPFQRFLAVLMVVGAPCVQAVHLDVELRGGSDKVDIGFCMTAGVGCDLPGALKQLGLPSGTLPVDWETGRMIFAADLADFPRPYETANPGFQAVGGALIPQELIRYEALDSLMYWNPDERTWRPADAATQIRLFGGLDAKTIVREDRSHCDGLLICIPKEIIETIYQEGSTTFQASGIGGSASLLVDNANTSGAFHTHLDWFLESTAGEAGGPRGAYLLSLRLLSDRRSQPSEAFLIAFNNGLNAGEFVSALAARIEDPTIVDPPPEPRPFSEFQYSERAAEKLKCKPECIEVVRGSSRIRMELKFDDQLAADTVLEARKLTFNLGTRPLVVTLTPEKLTSDGGTGSSRGALPVRNDQKTRVGSLKLNWTPAGLRLNYTLNQAVFGKDYLEDGGLARSTRVESVALNFRDQAGEVIATAQGTLTVDLLPENVKTRTVTREQQQFALSKLTFRGTYHP